MGAAPINFEKFKEELGVYYYYIFTHRLGIYEFFIGIDQVNHRVLFYDDKDLKKLIGIFDFAITDKNQPTEGVNLAVSNRIAFQAYKMIINNQFPDKFSVCN